ncbi:MAG: M15 family metallopeptidase, partial [Desulfovibrio fairfieldensis]|nr:M15 family metallopeptidase [Desulfovibrio fairfieldensis]
MMVTSSLQTIAPQRDIDGSLFLVNRTYRISEDYVPQVVQADVSGSLRSMRPEAAAALEEMFAACKEEAGVTLVTVSGYRSYQKQKNIYNNKLKSVGGSEEQADEYVARPGAREQQLGLAM